MELFKHYFAFVNGVNFFVKATFVIQDVAAKTFACYRGASIVSSSVGSTTLIVTGSPHGLAVSDKVRIVDHLQAAPVFAEGTDYTVVTVPSAVQVTLNQTQTAAGVRGFIGKKTRDAISSVNVDAVYVSNIDSSDRLDEDYVG